MHLFTYIYQSGWLYSWFPKSLHFCAAKIAMREWEIVSVRMYSYGAASRRTDQSSSDKAGVG